MDYLRIALSSLGSLVVLFFLTKLEGSRQISELTVFDYIISISIGSIAAEMATELEEPLKPMLAMIVYALSSLLISFLTAKSLKARKFIIGSSKTLMHNGKLCRNNFKKNHVDLSEFLMQCRSNGYFDLSEINAAILEASGKISFLPYSDQRPVTPRDMNIQPSYEGIYYNVVMDGIIIDRSLSLAGKDKNWLLKELQTNGFKSERDIFLATLDTNGTLNIFKNIDSKEINYG